MDLKIKPGDDVRPDSIYRLIRRVDVMLGKGSLEITLHGPGVTRIVVKGDYQPGDETRTLVTPSLMIEDRR
jgi:hypothetical protein